MVLFSLKHFYSIKLLIYIPSVHTALFPCLSEPASVEQFLGGKCCEFVAPLDGNVEPNCAVFIYPEDNFFLFGKLQVIWQEN